MQVTHSILLPVFFKNKWVHVDARYIAESVRRGLTFADCDAIALVADVYRVSFDDLLRRALAEAGEGGG
jgi:hypothetical protein